MSTKGLLIGIALIVLGAALAVGLGTEHGLSRSLGTSASSDIRGPATLEQLQNALAAEVQSRRELADRIAELDAELSLLRRAFDKANGRPLAQSEVASEDSLSNTNQNGEAQPDLAAEVDVALFDGEVLLSRGVHPSDVARLHDRWASYELDRQTIADSALREGWFFTDRHRQELARTDRELREDLPDADYDQYLYALGKPNRVVAGEVLPGSAASAAGLRRGDIILNYGDVRVFKPGEVIRASSEGDAGGSTPLIYLRDGRKRTAYVELGPLGAILEHSKGEPFTD